MSLRLFVDADTQRHKLVRLLRDAGHDVQTANEAGLREADDDVIFAQALYDGRTILTRNASDFEALHSAFPDHHGIIVIHPGPSRSKGMANEAIVAALYNWKRPAGLLPANLSHSTRGSPNRAKSYNGSSIMAAAIMA